MPLTTFDEYTRAIKCGRRWDWLLRWLTTWFLPGTAEMLTRAESQEIERQTLAMIGSMTSEERMHPEVINRNRSERIARGSGTSPMDVRELVRIFLFLRDQSGTR